MGKKKSRATQTSHGTVDQRPNKIAKALRREYRASFGRLINQLIAHNKGKNVVLTVPNPNTNNTKERYIKVPSREYWRMSSKR